MKPMPTFLHLNFTLSSISPLCSKTELNWVLVFHFLYGLFAGSCTCSYVDRLIEPFLTASHSGPCKPCIYLTFHSSSY